MAQMLDTLVRLEEKIDHMSLPTTASSSSSWYARSVLPSLSQWTPGAASSEGTEQPASEFEAGTTDVAKAAPPYFTAPHRTIVWPAIYSCIIRLVPKASAQLAQLATGGTSWLMYVAHWLLDRQVCLALTRGVVSST